MKKTVWFEVEDGETISACIERMSKAGYTPIGRKEEPVFIEEDGKMSLFKQVIKFKGTLL